MRNAGKSPGWLAFRSRAARTKKDKNGGRAVQKGNVPARAGGDHLRGIEPMLQPDARAEGLINSASSADRPVMGIDRHRQNGAIRGGEIQFLRIGVNRAEQVIVGDNRPLGSPVVPEEHHHRRIVAVNRDRRAGQRGSGR
ncbi:hypothetical protein MJ575_14835 [Klebsiella pneumoniae]|nr:hypothetical protein MJ575_14835 [Klebsiella pneumoniae]